MIALPQPVQQVARPIGGRPQLAPPKVAAAIDDTAKANGVAWVPIAPTTATRKRLQHRCQRRGCGSPAGKKKALCSKHHHQALKARDIISYIYSARKQRAKARGKEWTITLANFRDWCQFTGYHREKGRTAASASIDRKDGRHGYHVWNIRSIPYGANSAKGSQNNGCWSQDAEGHYHFTEEEEPPF
ncbi:hypothetical protein ACFQ48_16765 [Hymenobacter caeli]|uniref:HNH endonuclease n=1 Tax=Hymenobacter caeli TaxID=2735894 RepID=A0ABX2FQB8_9BACT|nr:hypothetical protein [Hymenobacter caeli]NRT19358.1 hypothetical protein [Hymenobacter caeli]